MTGVLWIVQDGVLSGPGASQTLPYLRGLAARGHRLHLLSFEKEAFLRDARRRSRVRRELGGAGVGWTPLPYGTGAGAPRTGVQVARAVATGRGIVRRQGLALVHARSYLPGLMALGIGRPFLFDMRGLWPLERVDGGVFREGGVAHRAGLALERVLLRRAAGVVVLARGALEHLPELSKPLRVIPTAVDLDRFRPGLPPPAGFEYLADREVYVIAGALGTWYRLPEMLDLAARAVARSPRGHVLLLTEEDTGAARRGLAERGVPAGRITVRGVPHAEVPNWFSVASAGILLIKSAPSKRASAPTKLGEFLACGVPVVTTPGIGDSEELLRRTATGVIVRDFGPRGLDRALDELERLREDRRGLEARCRRTAVRHLSLPAAVDEYEALYEALTEGGT